MSGNNPQSSLDRRSLLKAAGASGAVVGMQGVVWGSNEERRRVPRTVGMGGDAKTTMKVPKEWHDHTNAIRKAKRSFHKEYGHREGVDRTALVGSDKQQGGRQGFQLKLAICPEEYSGDRPEQYRGYDVVIEEMDCDRGVTEDDSVSTSSQTCYYNDGNWSTIYGGIAQWRESSTDRSSEQPKGTTAWEVEYGGQRYIQTSHHMFTGSSCPDEDIVGEMSHQEDQSQGPVEYGMASYDACLIDPNAYNWYDIENAVADEDGTSAWPIVSWHSYTSISNMYLSGETYRKIGTMTGETSGQIQEFAVSGSCYDSEGVRGALEVKNGDSGSPAFTVSNGNAELVCMKSEMAGNLAWMGDCVQDYVASESMGPAAYQLANAGWTPVTN